MVGADLMVDSLLVRSGRVPKMVRRLKRLTNCSALVWMNGPGFGESVVFLPTKHPAESKSREACHCRLCHSRMLLVPADVDGDFFESQSLDSFGLAPYWFSSGSLSRHVYTIHMMDAMMPISGTTEMIIKSR